MIMDLLKTISVPIDSKSDGVSIELNLYSKGQKPDWRDERVQCLYKRHLRCQSNLASEAQPTGLRTHNCKPLFAVRSQKHSSAFDDTMCHFFAHPKAIVRVIGARFSIINNNASNLEVKRFYLVIIKDRRIQKVYSPSSLNTTDYNKIEVSFEAKQLTDILENHKEEKDERIQWLDKSHQRCQSAFVSEAQPTGLRTYTSSGIKDFKYISEAFDGDTLEQQLKNLNNVDHDEYQNISQDDFAEIIELESWVPIVNVLTIEEREDLLI